MSSSPSELSSSSDSTVSIPSGVSASVSASVPSHSNGSTTAAASFVATTQTTTGGDEASKEEKRRMVLEKLNALGLSRGVGPVSSMPTLSSPFFPSSSPSLSPGHSASASTASSSSSSDSLPVSTPSVLGKRKLADVVRLEDEGGRRRRRLLFPSYVSSSDEPWTNFFSSSVRGYLENEFHVIISLDAHEEKNAFALVVTADDEMKIEKLEKDVNTLIAVPDYRELLRKKSMSGFPQSSSSSSRGGGGGGDRVGFPANSSSAAALAAPVHTMRIPADRVGLAIGKGGETIKRLQMDFNVSINVGKDSNDGMRTITFGGNYEDARRVEEEIWRIIRSDSRSDRDRGGGGGGGSGGGGGGDRMMDRDRERGRGGLGYSDSQRVVLSVPSNLVGLLIGNRGENVQRLQRMSGATVSVQRESECAPGAPAREVVISGPAAAVDSARREIDGILAQQRTVDSAGTFRMVVENAVVGVVIGRKGENIQKISRDTHTKISISRDMGGRDSSREIVITGIAQDIEVAKFEINQLVATARAGKHATLPSYPVPSYGYGGYPPPHSAYPTYPYPPPGSYPPPGQYPPYDYSQYPPPPQTGATPPADGASAAAGASTASPSASSDSSSNSAAPAGGAPPAYPPYDYYAQYPYQYPPPAAYPPPSSAASASAAGSSTSGAADGQTASAATGAASYPPAGYPHPHAHPAAAYPYGYPPYSQYPPPMSSYPPTHNQQPSAYDGAANQPASTQQ